MCSRPAAVSVAIECPECGKKINPVMGNLPKECPFCETPLENASVAGAPGTPAPPVPAPKAQAGSADSLDTVAREDR